MVCRGSISGDGSLSRFVYGFHRAGGAPQRAVMARPQELGDGGRHARLARQRRRDQGVARPPHPLSPDRILPERTPGSERGMIKCAVVKLMLQILCVDGAEIKEIIV